MLQTPWAVLAGGLGLLRVEITTVSFKADAECKQSHPLLAAANNLKNSSAWNLPLGLGV